MNKRLKLWELIYIMGIIELVVIGAGAYYLLKTKGQGITTFTEKRPQDTALNTPGVNPRDAFKDFKLPDFHCAIPQVYDPDRPLTACQIEYASKFPRTRITESGIRNVAIDIFPRFNS